MSGARTEHRAEIEEAIFAGALALPVAARREFVTRQCEANGADVSRVLGLLDGFLEASGFLETPAAAAALASVGASTLPPEPAPGDRIGRYRLLERIGEGGFGIVFLAEQEEPVRRHVALKLIRLGLDTREFIARFEQERQALALMEHPNIARVFDAGATENGRPYLVMELVRGMPITTYCDEHRLPLDARLRLFLRVCSAIQHAHQKGVVHRDLKPSNILVAPGDAEAMPRIIDFGIAKATRAPLTECTRYTRHHALIGTPAYTSPEQIDPGGGDADTRSDVYSLGVLLYEVLTGCLPFDRAALEQGGLDGMRRLIRDVEPLRPSVRVAALADGERLSIANRRRIDAAKLAPMLRSDLDWIVLRCLEKEPSRRYETANALALDVQRHLDHEPVGAHAPSPAYQMAKFVRRHRLGVAASVAILAVVVLGSVLTAMQAVRALRAERRQREASEAALRAENMAAEARREAEAQAQRLVQTRWAREIALPEIARLYKNDDVPAALALARQIEALIPDDPVLTGLWPQIAARVSIATSPPGADIYIKPYSQPEAEWQYLGRSPLTEVRLPRCTHRWRIEKDGCTTLEYADRWLWGLGDRRVERVLHPTVETPAGMVRVVVESGGPLQDFWIDRHEVTNREFKAFVAQGGYATEKFWKHEFVRAGATLPWSEAMALFRDRGGQSGPAGWEHGTYPENEADFPVTGISWFEAAAYAEFAGKRLPSVAHWREAGSRDEAHTLLQFANLGPGPAPVGSHPNLSFCGAVDLAGNAKEWCFNEASGGQRYLLGGGWNEPDYMFTAPDAASPFARGPQYGFRCIKLDDGAQVAASVDAPVTPANARDYAAEQPLSDAQFAIVRRNFDYDPTDLEPRVERVEENSARRVERVTFNAAYDGARMIALLYLPRTMSRPYQTIVYFPGIGARAQTSSEAPRDRPMIEALAGTGRAVVFPIYAGTFERVAARGPGTGEVGRREWCERAMKDLRRTIDYLETRPDDFQPHKLAFVGISWGATWGPIASAVEERIKANVLLGGGFIGGEPQGADPFHFAPRVRVPTLMINGRHDFLRDFATSQQPFFRALGAEVKEHAFVEGGHGLSAAQVSTAIRAWLDRHLGAP